jgi:signal transduction histidine kinase
MRLLEPVEDRHARSRASWAFDGFVTFLAFVTAFPVMHHQDHRGHAGAVLLLAVIVAPLVVRRIWPAPVFGWVLATSFIAEVIAAHAASALAVGVALYTVAKLLQRRDALIAAGLLELAAIAAAIRIAGSGWWYDAIFLSGLIAAALALGLYAGTRRAYLAELHDRADRLERERDQQVALAAAAERTRIAREMHDVVAHHLTVMVALSDGAVAASANSPERAADVMRNVSATGRRALGETRRMLGVLRQPGEAKSDERQPMPDLADIETLIAGVRAAGLPTTLEMQGSTADLPSGVQLTAYRLVQEALTNTLKHGGPGASAAVRLRRQTGELSVEVVDDGAGRAAPTPVGVGGGLAGMQQRVHAYGGDVLSGPREPGGWRVAARLRFDEDEHQDKDEVPT